MNTFIVIFMAASTAATANFFFRKGSKNETGYIINYYLVSFIISFFLFPDVFNTPWSTKAVFLGGLVGVLNFLMMQTLAQALKTGPSGLTFVIQNVGFIFPGVLLFLFFGERFGFEYHLSQFFGMLLVVSGVVLGVLGKKEAANEPKKTINKKWFFFALSSFLIQVVALLIIQWRCLVFTCDMPEHMLIPWTLDPKYDVYFMPAQFGVSLILQFIVYLFKRERLLNYGIAGGVFNGFSTFLLLLATKVALPWEATILFPVFASCVIVLCNLWASRFFNEKFNIASNLVCVAGVLVSSIH